MIENLFNLLSEFPLEFGDFGSVGSSRRCIRVLINLSKWGVRVLMGFILRKEELNNMFEKKARLLSYLVTVWQLRSYFSVTDRSYAFIEFIKHFIFAMIVLFYYS